MGPIAEQIFDGSLIAAITAILTWLGLSWRMERKYRTIAEAKLCMAARVEKENMIEEKLERIKKRLIFGNLLLLRLSKELKIDDDELKQMKSAAEFNMSDEH